MSSRAERIRAVVTRAKQHIQDFQLGLAAFYQTRPYEVRTDEQSEPGQRLYRVTKLDPLPDPVTAIAADVIQNLRSPLDMLAYQLVLDAHGGTHPQNKRVVYYPITSAASEYKALRARNIKGVRQAVIDAIDATEPYPGGKGHRLWQLNELNKIPKHQDLLSVATVEDGVDLRRLDMAAGLSEKFRAAFDLLPTVFIRSATAPPLNVGDVIDRMPIDAKVDNKRQFPFAVTFHTPGVIEREPALKFLHDTANLVDDIVTRLGNLLL